MKRLISIIILIFIAAFCKAEPLPAWFLKSFDAQKLNQLYIIVNRSTPQFLEADFNGDKVKDIAVQVKDAKTGKLGLLIINYGQNSCYVFGAGKKFSGETFDQTKWIDGWKIFTKKNAYKPSFKTNGDIESEKKVKIKYNSIYVYKIEDGDDIAGELIYWDGIRYRSIHQGE